MSKERKVNENTNFLLAPWGEAPVLLTLSISLSVLTLATSVKT